MRNLYRRVSVQYPRSRVGTRSRVAILAVVVMTAIGWCLSDVAGAHTGSGGAAAGSRGHEWAFQRAESFSEDPMVRKRQHFGLDASPERIAQLRAEGRDSPGPEFGMTRREAVQVHRQLQIQAELQDARGPLREWMGDHYGGAVIDHLERGRITIFAAGGGDRALFEAFARELVPSADEVVVVAVEYGDDELEALEDAVMAAVNELAELGVEVDGAGIDRIENRLRISIATLDQHAADTVTVYFGHDPRITLAETPIAEAQASVRPGGRIHSDWGRCSAGFPARYNSTRVLVTAGHCGPNGSTWYNDFYGSRYQWIGTMAWPSTYGLSSMQADVGIISLGSGVTVPHSVISTFGHLPLVAPSPSGVKTNDYVCRVGASSPESCAYVTSHVRQPATCRRKDKSLMTIQQATRAPYSTAEGDSGGLVFTPRPAAWEARTVGVVNCSGGYFSDWVAIKSQHAMSPLTFGHPSSK
jgi:hypothetical protein